MITVAQEQIGLVDYVPPRLSDKSATIDVYWFWWAGAIASDDADRYYWENNPTASEWIIPFTLVKEHFE